MTGLAIFAVASLTFWPSSSLLSFPGFVVSNILLGSGLSVLAIAANLFTALSGPEHLMESRLNFVQGIQGVGLAISPVLVEKVFFKQVTRAGLYNSQWAYLAISLWASFLGVVLYYLPLGEASDDDIEVMFEDHMSRKGLEGKKTVWGIQIAWFLFAVAIFEMLLYLGAQQMVYYNWGVLVQYIDYA